MKEGETYCCWDERFFLQQTSYCLAINYVVLLIYLLTCSLDEITPPHIVNMGECLALQYVSMLAHVGHTI